MGNPKVLPLARDYVPPDGLPSITELNQRVINAVNKMNLRGIAPQVSPQTTLNTAWQVMALERILVRAGLCTDGDFMYFMTLCQCEDLERISDATPAPVSGLVMPKSGKNGN